MTMGHASAIRMARRRPEPSLKLGQRVTLASGIVLDDAEERVVQR